MYSSRMRTVRCSGRLGEGGVSTQTGGVCQEGALGGGTSAGGVSAQDGCLPGGCTFPPCEQNDRQV